MERVGEREAEWEAQKESVNNTHLQAFTLLTWEEEEVRKKEGEEEMEAASTEEEATILLLLLLRFFTNIYFSSSSASSSSSSPKRVSSGLGLNKPESQPLNLKPSTPNRTSSAERRTCTYNPKPQILNPKP